MKFLVPEGIIAVAGMRNIELMFAYVKITITG